MSATNFRATVNASGDKLHAQDKSALHAALAPHAGRDVVVTVETYREKRSNSQNRYYHGVVLPIVRDFLSRGRDLPLSSKQAHELLKRVFIGEIDTPLGPVPKSSAELDVEQFVDFVESVCSHFTAEHGLYFPSPGE